MSILHQDETPEAGVCDLFALRIGKITRSARKAHDASSRPARSSAARVRAVVIASRYNRLPGSPERAACFAHDEPVPMEQFRWRIPRVRRIPSSPRSGSGVRVAVRAAAARRHRRGERLRAQWKPARESAHERHRVTSSSTWPSRVRTRATASRSTSTPSGSARKSTRIRTRVAPHSTCAAWRATPEAFVAMLGDIVRHGIFPEAEIERERQVILHEYTEDEDDPMSTAFKLFDVACYGDHAMARPVIGTRGQPPALHARRSSRPGCGSSTPAPTSSSAWRATSMPIASSRRPSEIFGRRDSRQREPRRGAGVCRRKPRAPDGRLQRRPTPCSASRFLALLGELPEPASSRRRSSAKA